MVGCSHALGCWHYDPGASQLFAAHGVTRPTVFMFIRSPVSTLDWQFFCADFDMPVAAACSLERPDHCLTKHHWASLVVNTGGPRPCPLVVLDQFRNTLCTPNVMTGSDGSKTPTRFTPSTIVAAGCCHVSSS